MAESVKQGGLNQISWFQFLPHEFDFSTLPDKSVKLDHKDALPHLVLSAHQQLQNEGFLSPWTNSFVGSWDPSQGLHNPDETVKLWLFLCGKHSSVAEKVQLSVSRLRGLREIGKALLGTVAEQVMFLENIGTSVLVSENQLPELHQLMVEASNILNIEPPDLYVRQSPIPSL